MTIKNYGVLRGRAMDRKAEVDFNTPHYQIHLNDGEVDYRAAINVMSSQSPSELLYLIIDGYQHPMLDVLVQLPQGFKVLPTQPGGMALDYIRGNLFDPQKMTALPHVAPGPDNDLNEKLDFYVQKAIHDPAASLFIFGEPWGPDPGNDKIFRFSPKRGIHNVHMNQGNVPRFQSDDGVWHDGGILMHFSALQRWVAVFLAFQSQSWHTDDTTGHRLDLPPKPPEETGTLIIIAARVNPAGHDPGKETVTLINFGTDDIDLSGYAIADRNKNRSVIKGVTIAAGRTALIELDGNGAQLGNKGGIITLLNPEGLKLHGVSYTKAQAKKSGYTIVFRE